METLFQQYKDQGLMVFSAWSEDESGDEPDVADLQRWADEYGLTIPVVSDPWGNLGGRFNGVSPLYVMLEPGMVIHNARSSIREEDLAAILDMYQP